MRASVVVEADRLDAELRELVVTLEEAVEAGSAQPRSCAYY